MNKCSSGNVTLGTVFAINFKQMVLTKQEEGICEGVPLVYHTSNPTYDADQNLLIKDYRE
jgi:hypothetical protein